MAENVQCPVCTLFLHAGMNLSDHLDTHPKEQVIKALVKLTISGGGTAATRALTNMLNDVNPKQETEEQTVKKDEHDESNSSTTFSTTSSVSRQSPSSMGCGKPQSTMPLGSLPSSSSALNCNKYSSLNEKSLNFSMNSKASPNQPQNLTANHNAYHHQRHYSYESTSSTANATTTTSTSISEIRSEETILPKDFTNPNYSNTDHNSHQQAQHLKLQSSSNQEQNPAAVSQLANAKNNFNHQQNQYKQNLTQRPQMQQQEDNHHQQLHQQQAHLLPPPPPPLPPPSAPQNHNLNVPSLIGQQVPSSNEQNYPRTPLAPPGPSHQQQSNLASSSMTNQMAYSTMQMHQQHTVSIAHQRQQHLVHHQQHHHQQQQQQQNMKIVYSPNLPPPPPLQLFPYHNQPQHQRPPPAYGAAISQIRSQHYQNKHLASSIQQTPMTNSHLQQNQQPQHLQNPSEAHFQSENLATTEANPPTFPLHRVSTGKSMQNLSNTSKNLSTGGKSPRIDSPHSRSSSKTNTSSSHKSKSSTLENYLQYGESYHYQQQQQNRLQPQHLSKFNLPPSNHPLFDTVNNQVSSSVNSIPAHLPRQNFSIPSEFQSSNPSTSSNNLTRANASGSSLRSATPSSVLCFAEPPVAHYLERDNGDFIVQETPKHIVECVEKENGEFSVIERIYQSPPSVLHIHDDDDDDDEDEDYEPSNESSQQSESVKSEQESKSQSNISVDEDEFMSRSSGSDDEFNNSRCKEIKNKRPKKKSSRRRSSSCKSLNQPLNLESSGSSISASTSKQTHHQDGLSKTGPHTQRKKKNTVTVLSDVQLNPNEYLDLVENIIATSKSHRLRLSSFAPLPLVKVEKEEPPDDYEGNMEYPSDERQEENESITSNHILETENLVKIDKAEDIIIDDDANERDEREENEVKEKTEESSLDYHSHFDDTNSSIKSYKSQNTTSVIRMASSNNSQNDSNLQGNHSQHQHHYQDLILSPAGHGNDENIAEDLSKPQLKTENENESHYNDNEITLNNNPPINSKTDQLQPEQPLQLATNNNSSSTLRSSSSLPIKKGPKKLIIKPKATAKTDHNAKNITNSSSFNNNNNSFIDASSSDLYAHHHLPEHQYQDDLPSTSAMAQKHLDESLGKESYNNLNLDNNSGSSSGPKIIIKSEPNSNFDSSQACRSILEQHLTQNSTNTTDFIQCKEEKPFIQENSFDLQLTETTPRTLSRNGNDTENEHEIDSPDNEDNSETNKNSSNDMKEMYSLIDNSASSNSIIPNPLDASVALHGGQKKVVASARYSLTQSLNSENSENSETIINSNSQQSGSSQHIILSSTYSSPLEDVTSNSSQSIKSENKQPLTQINSNSSHQVSLTEQQHQQHSQNGIPLTSDQQPAQPSFSEYPFNFLYNNSNLNNNSEITSSEHKISNEHNQQNRTNFSPFYHHANDATNAATLGTSSTSNTANNTSLQLDDSTTSVPIALHANFGSTIVTASASNTNSQWFTHHHHNHLLQNQQNSNLPSSQLQQQHQTNSQPPQPSSSHQELSSNANTDFSAALASVDCNAAVDSGDVGRYLDLDSCKREITHGIHTTSTSSSFTNAGGDSNLAGGLSTDALNIRTDEKMPAKGEISEQESNCDIDNSWSQPMFGDRFPGIFPHDNGCWGQGEYMDVQDLSANAANDSTNHRANKSFDFRFSQEAGTSASLLGNTSNRNVRIFTPQNDVMPSTSATASKKKRKRDTNTQPTATVTSQQLMLQQQQQQQFHVQQQQPLQQQFPQIPSSQFAQFQHPTSWSALMAGPLNNNDQQANTIAAPNISPSGQGVQAKPRKKAYQCPHCNLICTKLKDRNNHLISEHNYVRQNRRLICLEVNSINGNSTNALMQPLEVIDDSKEGLIKMEMEPQNSTSLSGRLSHEDEFAVITKKEPAITDKDNLGVLTQANLTGSSQIDTKPNIAPLSLTTPASKLSALYRMLVTFNASVLKQNTNMSEIDEKINESSIFYCYVCRENFSSVKMYDAHLTEHAAECFTCGKKFQRWKNFSLHLKRHMGWKEFACNVCDKRFVVRNALVEHLRMHTGQTPLKCKICGKHFKRYSNLTQHRKRHTKHIIRKKEYICHCGEVLPSKARYRWHKETHDSKPKCCPHCCDRFVHMNSLRRHIRLAHSDKFDYNEPMECPMCKQVFAKTSIKAHMATHSTDAQYSCAICNKTFSTKWNLKIHSWVHANRTAKPFKCEHCPKAFVRELDFKNHMNAHKQIKPYTCEYCGCKFIRKYNYMRHRREHHGKKRFTCDCCDKSFHRHYYLIEHRRIHTGERPYQCTICGKSSTTKTNHNKHLKIHHSRDPFTVET